MCLFQVGPSRTQMARLEENLIKRLFTEVRVGYKEISRDSAVPPVTVSQLPLPGLCGQATWQQLRPVL